jgi:hypothetical protein
MCSWRRPVGSCAYECSSVRGSSCAYGRRWLLRSFLCEVSQVLGAEYCPCQSASGEPKGRKTHRFRSYGSSNARQLPRRLKRREGRLWSSELVVFHKSRPLDHDDHPKTALSRRRRYRLRARLRGVLLLSGFGGQKGGFKTTDLYPFQPYA